jgi:hypothetical protein
MIELELSNSKSQKVHILACSYEAMYCHLFQRSQEKLLMKLPRRYFITTSSQKHLAPGDNKQSPCSSQLTMEVSKHKFT